MKTDCSDYLSFSFSPVKWKLLFDSIEDIREKCCFFDNYVILKVTYSEVVMYKSLKI